MHMLDKLSDPELFHDPVDINGVPTGLLVDQLRDLVLLRMAEQHLAAMRKDGLIGGPVHLGVGQEAIAVGVSKWLRNSDRVFGTHRSHSHLLALGSSLHGLFAEVLGKETGHSRGMGGSMHLYDRSNGFYGAVPIVAGTVSLAVGAAMAARLQATDDIAVAYFGDGACEEGIVHESLNLSKITKAPILFVVENNLFASHMHVTQRQPSDSMVRFAHANGISSAVVDGNDVVAVQNSARKLIQEARDGKGPGYLEAVTYRWYGHVDWRDDIDVGVKRSMDDVQKWRARDPIKRLKHALINEGCWDELRHDELCVKLKNEIDHAWERAMSDSYPDESKLLDYVYASLGDD